MKEEWRDIKGFEGKYQISSLGRVKSLDTERNVGKFNGKYLNKGRVLKQGLNGTGYFRAYFILNRVRFSLFIHRLVAEHFIENPNNLPIINHKDGNKLNNNLYNIEMCTVRYNTLHAFDNNLCLSLEGENTHLNKYSKEFVQQVYDELEHVKRYPNGKIKAGELILIADKLGTTRHVIKNYSRNRKIWKHLFRSATTIREDGVDSSESKCQPPIYG